MAKSKHQALAPKIAEILSNIDRVVEQTKTTLQMVLFFFYEKILVLGVPLKSQDCLQQIFKTHAVGMSILSPSMELRMACSSYPSFCSYRPLPFRLRSQCVEIQPNQPFATWWGIKTDLPKKMESLIEKGFWETLLYCPDSTEISYEIDWFEKENHVNSFSFTMLSAYETIGRENAGKAIIRKNLEQMALPHFRSVVEEWKKDPEGYDTVSKNPIIVFSHSFAPIYGENLDAAYAKVRRALREGSSKHYKYLMTSWRDRLEVLFFADVAWTDSEKKSFIKEWEINLFGCPIKRRAHHDGRWNQDMAIDRQTAGKIIKYFIDRFCIDPSKRKRDGEIACMLWMLIWCAQDPDAKNITITRVLAFETTNVSEESASIVFDDKSIDISLGLHQLLTILRGKGEGKRRRRLFDLSADYLQQALKEASIALFGADSTPVLPAAFLLFPHPMDGIRLPKERRRRLRDVDPGSAASQPRRQILETLRKNKPNTPFSSP